MSAETPRNPLARTPYPSPQQPPATQAPSPSVPSPPPREPSSTPPAATQQQSPPPRLPPVRPSGEPLPGEQTSPSARAGAPGPGAVAAKKVLIVTAHPEPRSLTVALAGFAGEHLRAAGHEVRGSDLYAMKWKAVVDADDFPDRAPGERLDVLAAHEQATRAGRLTADVAAEQEKVAWADAVVLQFPMWWFSVPAILKGWIDRVFTNGWAHGPAVPPPYTEGALGGRRALAAVTIGAREPAFSERGLHGALADVLHPLQHGLFWFTGMAPLEPFAVHDTIGLPPERARSAMAAYARRLDGLFTDPPVPFRPLSEREYDHGMRLLPGVERPGTSGLRLHLRPGPERANDAR